MVPKMGCIDDFMYSYDRHALGGVGGILHPRILSWKDDGQITPLLRFNEVAFTYNV